MNSKMIIFIIVLIFLITVPTKISFQTPTAPVIYVSGNGDGDYNCDGKDDHIQVNQALKFVEKNEKYTTVHLKGPFTYTINSTLLVGNNTILEGDSDAVVKLKDEAGWNGPWVPMIGNMDSINGNHDIIIQGFEIDGNSENQSSLGNDQYGSGYYSLIGFETRVYNITIQNMFLHNGCNDAARLKYGSSITPLDPGNVIFRNNKVYKIGHDALYCIGINNVSAYNNEIYTRVNSAIRLHNSNHAKIYNNHIYSELSGHSTGPGIEIQRTPGNIMDDIEIYNNFIHTLNGAGILFVGGDMDNIIRGTNVHIHNNIFHRVGQYWIDTGYSNAAIITGQYNNTTIEENVFIDSGHSGVQTGISSNGSYIFTTIIKNNTFISFKNDKLIGIFNNDSTHNIFISQDNYFINDTCTPYKGTNILFSDDRYVNIITSKFFENLINHN